MSEGLFEACRLYARPVVIALVTKHINRYVCSTASSTESFSLDALWAVVASVALAPV